MEKIISKKNIVNKCVKICVFVKEFVFIKAKFLLKKIIVKDFKESIFFHSCVYVLWY